MQIASTTPSPILITTPPAPVPAHGGLWTPGDGGLVVPTLPMVPGTTGDMKDVVGQVKAAWTQLSAQYGEEVARTMLLQQLNIANRVHSDEVHARIVAALMSGDVTAALNAAAEH